MSNSRTHGRHLALPRCRRNSHGATCRPAKRGIGAGSIELSLKRHRGFPASINNGSHGPSRIFQLYTEYNEARHRTSRHGVCTVISAESPYSPRKRAWLFSGTSFSRISVFLVG